MAFTEFYVTKGAAANNLNGGGPRLGADDGPVYSTADATSGDPGTTITDNVSTWTGCQAGDWLLFDTGGAKQYTYIVSITDAVATVGVAVTANQANKAVRVGGAWATVDFAASTINPTFTIVAATPPCVNIKAGTYAESVVIDNDGNAANPLTFEGYSAAANDGLGEAVIDATGTGAIAVSCSKDYIRFKNLYAIQPAYLYAFYTNQGDYCHFINCRASAGRDSYMIQGAYTTLLNCVSVDSGEAGFRLVNYAHYAVLEGCVAFSAGTFGFRNDSMLSVKFANCISHGSADDCFYIGDYGGVLDHCIGYGSTNGSGVRIDSNPHRGPLIINGIFEGNNQYGIECDDASMMLEDYNGFCNNGVAERKNILFVGAHDVVRNGVGKTFFVDAPGKDMRLNDRVGEGGDLRGAGFPGLMLDDS